MMYVRPMPTPRKKIAEIRINQNRRLRIPAKSCIVSSRCPSIRLLKNLFGVDGFFSRRIPDAKADYLPKAAKGIAWRGRWRRLVGPCVTRKCCEIPTQPKGGHRRSKLAVVLALICEPGRALIGQSGGARVPARQID